MLAQIALLIGSIFWIVLLILVTTGSITTTFSIEMYMTISAIYIVGLLVSTAFLTSNK